MPHSYISIYVHYVFGAKRRARMITPELEKRLHPYLGGIARENDMKALAIGGIEDHVHVLLSLPRTLSVAKAVQLLKGASSKWVHDTFPEHQHFEWQGGYGAFSVSTSRVEATAAYIHRQKEHHHRRTFQDEYIALLKKHGVEYDERDMWD